MKPGGEVSTIKTEPKGDPQGEESERGASKAWGAVGGGIRDPRFSAQPGGGRGRGRSPPRSRVRPGHHRRSTPGSSGTPRPRSVTPGTPFW